MVLLRLLALLLIGSIVVSPGYGQTTKVVEVGVSNPGGAIAFHDIDSNTFSSSSNPASTRIHEGDSVQFTWRSNFHNVNPYDPMTYNQPKDVVVDSAAIMALNWNATSRYSNYLCTNHRTTMTGQIFVFEIAKRFAIEAPANVVTGIPFDIKVHAQGQNNSDDGLYPGTIRFSSSDADPGVVLPPNYTFVPGDNGVHTFTGVVLKTVNSGATLTVTATAGGLSGQVTISVDNPKRPNPPTNIRVSP